MRFLSDENVNCGRQFEVDFAKFICILGMVFVHCFETASGGTYSLNVSSLEYVFVNVLDTLFGADVFMFCMGLGIAFSKNKNPLVLIKRGFITLLCGYLLGLIIQIPFFYNNAFFYFLMAFDVDIMPFAGVAFVLFGVLRKLKLSDKAIGGVGVALSLMASFIGTVSVQNPFSVNLLGLFIGASNTTSLGFYFSYFPLFNWFIFVALGNLFGILLKHCSNKPRFYLAFSLPSFVVLIIYMMICVPKKIGLCGEILGFYHMGLPSALVCICSSVSVLGFFYLLFYYVPNKLKHLVTNVSILINKIYCTQWVLICYTFHLIDKICENGANRDLIISLWAMFVFFLSVLIAIAIDKLYNKHKCLTESDIISKK